MSGLPLQPEEFFWEASWSILWSPVWLTFAGVARGFGEWFLLGFSSVKTALLGGSIWFSGSRWRGRLNLSSSDQQMDDFQEILCHETWADKSVLGRVVKYFGFFLARGLSFWPRITSQLEVLGWRKFQILIYEKEIFNLGFVVFFREEKVALATFETEFVSKKDLFAACSYWRNFLLASQTRFCLNMSNTWAIAWWLIGRSWDYFVSLAEHV